MSYKNSAAYSDRKDPLRKFREHFQFSDPSLVYVDGNSLGPLSVESEEYVNRTLAVEWGQRLIRGWNDRWWEMPVKLGNALAPLIGAREGEVLVCDSTSVNLFKLVWAALSFTQRRKTLLTDDMNFPSDLYIMQGVVKNHPGHFLLDIITSDDGITIPDQVLMDNITGNTAVVSLSLVSFKSAFMYEMKKVTRMAHSKGALMLWDLSHAAGAVPVDLEGSGADLAVGCTYKYLNGGPGSPAYLYIRKELQDQLDPPIWGWMGETNPFDFNLSYRPSGGIRKFLIGSPPVTSMTAIEPGLTMIKEAGMDRIRVKSISQSEFLIRMVSESLLDLGFTVGSPLDPERRGSHVSLRHAEGYRICQALSDPAEGAYTIIPDFREPDHIRIGIAPLYNSYQDLVIVVEELKRIVEKRIYKKYSLVRETIT